MDAVLDNPYIVLGVPETASAKQVRTAYRVAAKRYHPDASATADPVMFDAATRAFDVLRDAESRRRVDEALAATREGRAREDERCAEDQDHQGGQQWRVHYGYAGGEHTNRPKAPWDNWPGPDFADHVMRPSVSRTKPAPVRPSRAMYPLLGKLERKHVVPALAAGVIVAALYGLLALIRFDPGMTVGVKDAAAAVGPFHVAAAFTIATLVAWSAMGVRPKQRAAVVAASVFVVGGAAALTVVRSAALLGVIAFAVFIYAASHSRPRS